MTLVRGWWRLRAGLLRSALPELSRSSKTTLCNDQKPGEGLFRCHGRGRAAGSTGLPDTVTNDTGAGEAAAVLANPRER